MKYRLAHSFRPDSGGIPHKRICNNSCSQLRLQILAAACSSMISRVKDCTCAWSSLPLMATSNSSSSSPLYNQKYTRWVVRTSASKFYPTVYQTERKDALHSNQTPRELECNLQSNFLDSTKRGFSHLVCHIAPIRMKKARTHRPSHSRHTSNVHGSQNHLHRCHDCIAFDLKHCQHLLHLLCRPRTL